MKVEDDERAGGVETRRRVLELVHRYPGLHLRDIQRRIVTSAALVEYHLNLLEKWGLVTSLEDAGYRRFFPGRAPKLPLSREDQVVLSLLRQEVPLGIVLFMLEHPRTVHGEIALALGRSKSTLTYHLKRLEQAGIVRREEGGRILVLADRARLEQLLRAYEPTPDLIEAYAQLWLQLTNLFTGEPEGDR